MNAGDKQVRVLDAARFAAAAASYGGDLNRWPQALQAPAKAFSAAHRLEAERLLFEARLLDCALDLAPKTALSRDLFDRIAATGPSRRRKPLEAMLDGAFVLVFGRRVVLGAMSGAIAGLALVLALSLSLNASLKPFLDGDAVIDQSMTAPGAYDEAS